MTDDAPKPGSGTKTIDVKTFWRAIGVRASAVAVVTAQGAEGPSGFLALSATHLCADPPMLMVSIDKRTSTLAAVEQGKHFAINYLPRGAEAVSDMFGGKTDKRGADRFAPGAWGTLTTGAPVFNDAIGALDCVLEETIERHNTIIAIGRLVDYVGRPDGEPLLFFRGGYR
ncbi:flavin reductase [Pseudolabrys taiwanensis]|uniref:Flavin reductase n=1 Tax=Pseudolabrys taiwanensis TaxID=331696 RepID=A0A345ZSM9_9HYPH|nr:flavin reductase family protein [Pseudolabrys taiwanensis]AXK79926.1 flavin reductase [Pseudolabrys taiwanensis]